MRLLSAVPIVDHGPLSNASLAARTAFSTSSLPASATSAISSPVAGLYDVKVFPETESTNCPLMYSFFNSF